MNKMTHDEMLKYSAVSFIKNNPDEAAKLLVRLQEENKKLKARIKKTMEIIDIYGTYRLGTADLLYKALRGEE